MFRGALSTILRPILAAAPLKRAVAPSLASEVFGYSPPIASPKVDADPLFLQHRVLIYDGVCHLCHKGVKWVIRVDKDAMIKFCCLQSKAAEPYLFFGGVDREDVRKRVLFVEGPEGCYEGSTGTSLVLL
ncbi:hypothetical protein KSP39_PZI021108 [Platanthera zijinensis]|uniref:Uncharacterized protein n=1 Tax=Platanthera zijinensis TaxID=2320716 RepID=A0AAP0AXP0_9ASPA